VKLLFIHSGFKLLHAFIDFRKIINSWGILDQISDIWRKILRLGLRQWHVYLLYWDHVNMYGSTISTSLFPLQMPSSILACIFLHLSSHCPYVSSDNHVLTPLLKCPFGCLTKTRGGCRGREHQSRKKSFRPAIFTNHKMPLCDLSRDIFWRNIPLCRNRA
jgi:hypothetical protein